MIRLLLDAALAVYLFMPASPVPVTYTATSTDGGALAYHPQRGQWVAPMECFLGCAVPAGPQPTLLFGEIGLQPLADLGVTIHCNGIPCVWFYPFFGGMPAYDVRKE